MEKIVFHSVLPAVFAHRDDLHSEIWKQEEKKKKDHLYLVEADSGKGKSTFCSYVVGYRNDYTGQVMFDDTDTKTLKVKDWTDAQAAKVREVIGADYKVEGDLRSEIQLNIKRLMDIGCYRGIRHRIGLPVRGQSTKNNARTRKGKKKTVANKKKASK